MFGRLRAAQSPCAVPCVQNRTGRLGFRATRNLGVRIAAQKATFSSFEDLVQADAVLVDFYAVWCGPCQMMSKVLEEVSKEMKEHVKFVKINTEKYPSIASRYQVAALPTLVLFRNGKPVRRLEGALAAPDLKRWLQQSLTQSAAAGL